MNKKKTFGKIAALCLSLAFALSGAACGEGLVTTVSEKDMAQVVGTVNIADHADFEEGGDYAAYAEVIDSMNKNILKRDLVAYFLNAGSSYVNSYGYAETFRMLMNNLVSRKIMVQYAMAYYFDKEPTVYTVEGYKSYIESESAKITDETEKALYKAHPEVLTMKYFLTNGGKTSAEDTADYDRAVYTLKKMINNTLDSTEQNYIKKKDDASSASGESRTTPTGVGTETEDYYDTEYEIYTGRNNQAPSSCGSYERQEGSTQKTRQFAYNYFLANLFRNGLWSDAEDTTDFTKIDYYFVELAGQLEQAIITKYTDDLGKEADKKLDEEYVGGQYRKLLASQQNSYKADQSAFETAIGNVSDDSFVVYSPKAGFGFVYNILLPFSARQSQVLSSYTNDKGLSKKEFYAKRADLLEQVRGKDLRAAWFSSDKDKNYAYEAADGYYGDSGYLFFEDNLTKSEGENARYESLGQYLGKYAYNGTVTVDEDGEYTCKPTELSIDEFIAEMEDYLGSDQGAGLTVSGAKSSSYVTDGNYTEDSKGKFDYSEFLYYEGKVALTNTDHGDYFVKDTDSYKAVSAVNELMFAYSTDTGCLNKYMGYTVSPYKTSYMSEFEYAAQYAIKKGPGTYVVCPTDYGWHVIYVSFVYEDGEVYEFDWSDVENEVEGSFSYLYYQSLKSSNADTYTNLIQTEILGEYNKDTCVTLYEKRYKDLLSLEV